MKTYVAPVVPPEVARQYTIERRRALKERSVTDKPVTVSRVKINSSNPDFTVDASIQKWK